ncbi:hypothetical protein EYC80_005822 [Monilinia laxa]|uniref:Uncharacterized protein n=1 Tax=Monilinia laxa TaxID=61186 RepID=A0A5N6KFN5_MONLA|nr:hypothetical protein EYC80_005822 [Monilinia laxa]
MRFLSFFSLLLASVAIASPISFPKSQAADSTDLITRTPVASTYVDSAAYSLAIAAHNSLTKNTYYYFTLEWPSGVLIRDDDKETPDELKQLVQRLGFDHIGLVVGYITEREGKKVKGKPLEIARDFKAVVYHMVKIDSETKETKAIHHTYDPTPGKGKDAGLILKWGGQTTKKKDSTVKTAGTDYVANGHSTYSVDSNNCNDFVTAIKKKVQ